MLQSEFISRTNYTPTAAEWWGINESYNNSEVGKDSFCALWLKMNPEKARQAAEAKRAAAEAAKKEAQIDRIINALQRFVHSTPVSYGTPDFVHRFVALFGKYDTEILKETINAAGSWRSVNANWNGGHFNTYWDVRSYVNREWF